MFLEKERDGKNSDLGDHISLRSESALFPFSFLEMHTLCFSFSANVLSHVTLGLCSGEKHRIGGQGPWALKPHLLLNKLVT